MAELVEELVPAERQYLVKLSQSELDFIMGIVADLGDNPSRKVRMAYEVDDSYVAPTDKGMTIVNRLLNSGLSGTHPDDYEYFEYWEEVKRG